MPSLPQIDTLIDVDKIEQRKSNLKLFEEYIQKQQNIYNKNNYYFNNKLTLVKSN